MLSPPFQCDGKIGTHERVELDKRGVADLKLLFDAYCIWSLPNGMDCAWAAWIHEVLNSNSYRVRDGAYSLELVLEWSPIRITLVVLLPVLLSLAIGLWLNSADWTDLATMQTAWGTASYIVTAGGSKFTLLSRLEDAHILTSRSNRSVVSYFEQHTCVRCI